MFILVHGFVHPVVSNGRAPITGPEGSPWIAVVLAFPVAMALATGVEAPSSAIAQLGQLDQHGRRRFGQITLWLTLGIVAARFNQRITALDHTLGGAIP